MKGKILIQTGILLLFFINYFCDTLKSIFNKWMTDDDYFYGFFIPVIAGCFILEDRENGHCRPDSRLIFGR